MNNSQVAHVWAQQRKPEGEGSNFYFSGDTIYSFGGHFPIARFTEQTVNESRVVLFTIENGWGGYTGRHINFARNALSGLDVCVIECLEPAARNGSHNSPRDLSEDDRHARNLADYETRYTKALASAAKARTHGPLHIERAEKMRVTCLLYCEAFDINPPAWTAEEISFDKDAARERVAQAIERKRAKMAKSVSEWRAGENRVFIDEYPDTLLRLSSNGLHVETSRGASVPVKDARNLWRMVSRAQRWNDPVNIPPSKPFAVGDFELRNIRADGTCVVGCHTLTFEETRAFATAQGWDV
jgi:hypothetical protein